MSLVATTRFNDDTFAENNKYKEEKGITGCIYGIRLRIKEEVPLDTLMFVIEMNNDHNRIEGIGLIRNFILTDKYYKIHPNSDLNRYVYKGEHRIIREEMLEFNEELVECIEEMCFKGKSHQKRLPGITVASENLLKSPSTKGLNIKREIRYMFVLKYRWCVCH